jgi:hypothetical protein
MKEPPKATRKSQPDLPPGPNPAASRPAHVAAFGRIWAIVETLGVISTHRTREEAEAALAARLERRKAKRTAP